MKRFFIALLAIVFLVCGVAYLQDPIFWKNYSGLLKSHVLKEPRGNWYSPLEKVPGGQGTALLRKSESAIPTDVLDTVANYAQSNNSYSFVVWQGGAVVSEHYFQGYDESSLIISKSMAKPLASMVVARALELGHLDSLDQPVSDFIEEWAGTDKDAIRIRDVLNMSSGLKRFYERTLNPFSLFHRAFLSGKHEEVILDAPLVELPGSYFDYSQLTSDIIAVLIERATGQKYQQFLSDELLVPIDAAGGDIWVNREGGVAHSGCCIMLPTETWLKLGVLMAQGGEWENKRLLPDWWNDEVLKGSNANPKFSLNFWLGSPYQERRHFMDPNHLPNPGTLHTEPFSVKDLFMFDGFGNQVIYIVPSKELVVLRTGGWPGVGNGNKEWDNSFIPNTILKSMAAGESKTHSAPPPFSAAMQTYQPLDKIKGRFQPMFDAPTKDERFKKVIEYIEALSSYSLLVWQGGDLLVEEYFQGHNENLRPDSASMHKSVLGLLFLAALQDGHIDSADDVVSKYLPTWKGKPEGDIKLSSLLTMSSGLKPLSSQGGGSSPAFQFYKSNGAQAREALSALTLEAAQGTRFQYANTDSQLLAMVLEAATNTPYAEFMSKRLWQPIGASDAYVWNYDLDGFPRAYTALLARAKDWLRIGILIKDRGEFLGEDVLSASLVDQFTSPSKSNPNYGWQVWLGRQHEEQRFYNAAKTGVSFAAAEPFAIDDIIYLDGFGGQRVYISRELDLVIVRTGDVRMDWDDSKLPNMVIDALK